MTRLLGWGLAVVTGLLVLRQPVVMGEVGHRAIVTLGQIAQALRTFLETVLLT